MNVYTLGSHCDRCYFCNVGVLVCTHRTHIVWRSNKGLCKTSFMTKYSSKTKVTEFNIILAIEEDICWL